MLYFDAINIYLYKKKSLFYNLLVSISYNIFISLSCRVFIMFIFSAFFFLEHVEVI